jgi:hypothetical protein
MGQDNKVSGYLREGEHPEKSEISGNLPIVVAPEAAHTIRYVSTDWSQPRVPSERYRSTQVRDAAWR